MLLLVDTNCSNEYFDHSFYGQDLGVVGRGIASITPSCYVSEIWDLLQLFRCSMADQVKVVIRPAKVFRMAVIEAYLNRTMP